MNCQTDNAHYVYLHDFPDGSIYIGKGTGNRAYLKSKSKRSELWMRTAKKYGNPEVSFLKSGVCEELAFFIESEAIEIYRLRGHKMRNLAPGGLGGVFGARGELAVNYGRKKSIELIERLSIENSGQGNPHYGKRHSESAKRAIGENTKKNWLNNHAKMRMINKGRKHTAEHNAKIGAASRAMSKESRELIRQKTTGQKRTPEQLENYKRAGERRRGTKHSEATREKMSSNQWLKDKKIHKFIGPDGQAFEGMRSDFSREFGFSVNDLFRKDKKRRPHVKGWRLAGSTE